MRKKIEQNIVVRPDGSVVVECDLAGGFSAHASEADDGRGALDLVRALLGGARGSITVVEEEV